jgi:hypothetical protein
LQDLGLHYQLPRAPRSDAMGASFSLLTAPWSVAPDDDLEWITIPGGEKKAVPKEPNNWDPTNIAANVKPLISGYPFTPLSGPHEFRLLQFHPANHPSASQYTIHHFDRETAPGYGALSYCWGSIEDLRSIKVNGTFINITANLYNALTNLQKRISDMEYIWIDAICINQDDVQERTEQVGVMRDIYANAYIVFAWLGMELDIKRENIKFDAEKYCFHPKLKLEEIADTDAAIKEFINSVDIMSRRDYWTRVWILQELAVAQRSEFYTQYGSSLERNDIISRYHEVIAYVEAAKGSYSEADADTKDLLVKLKSVSGIFGIARSCGDEIIARGLGRVAFLYQAMAISWYSQASDPRDRIYALLGLVREGAGVHMRPDYSRSPCQVYGEAIRCLLQDAQVVDSQEVEKIKENIAQFPIHNPLNEEVDPGSWRCDGDFCLNKRLCCDYILRAVLKIMKE